MGVEITNLLAGRVTLAKQSPDFILEIADRLEPEVRRAFLRAVEALKKAIPVNQIADLLDDGRLTDALASLSDVPLPDLTEIRDAIANAAIRTSESVAVEFGMSFELVNERAVRWAQQHAGNMITNVNRETVKAVRDIIVRGQREGLNVRNQAQLIRSVVGLTDRDARAVDRFYIGLLEDVSERQARRQRDIMANRLLRRRAENIARTETIRASNMGTQLGWEAAQDQGFLPQSAQKVWIATEDSRTCPICAVLDGEVIGMRDGFNVDRQAVSFTQDGDDFRVAETVPLKRPSIERTPPAHPSCRCTVGLEFVPIQQRPIRVGDRTVAVNLQGFTNEQAAAVREHMAKRLEEFPDAHLAEIRSWAGMDNALRAEWNRGEAASAIIPEGMFIPSRRAIVIRKPRAGVSLELLDHELTHARLFERRGLDDLRDAAERAVMEFPLGPRGVPSADTPRARLGNLISHYALTNTDEFIAELASAALHREQHVARLPKTHPNLWSPTPEAFDRVVAAVRRRARLIGLEF